MIKQIEDIELEVKDNENKARQYIKENKRLLAKTYLRKKHLLEKNHGKNKSNKLSYVDNHLFKFLYVISPT